MCKGFFIRLCVILQKVQTKRNLHNGDKLGSIRLKNNAVYGVLMCYFFRKKCLYYVLAYV